MQIVGMKMNLAMPWVPQFINLILTLNKSLVYLLNPIERAVIPKKQLKLTR